MHLRQIFEAPSKRAAFALGRLNPATIGHERLVNKIKEQGADPFLFLTDRPAKLPDDPLTPQQKLMWANDSFDGIKVMLAKNIAIAAHELNKMGYTEVVFLEGEDKLFKILQAYNGKTEGKKGPIEFPFDFEKIDYVRLERDADDPGAKGMSASKLRKFAQDNDKDNFKAGLTQKAQPKAEVLLKTLQGAMGIDPVDREPTEDLDIYELIARKKELVVQQQKPKIDVLNNIAMRSDPKPFPLSWNAGKGEISIGGKVYVDPKNAKQFVSFFDRNEDKQEAMLKALKSASTTAKLFDVLGLKYKLDMEQ